MKRYLFLLLLLVFTGAVQAQQESPSKGDVVLYTIFVNKVPANFSFPLIGFVNLADGQQTKPQIGFINYNAADFSSVQISFVNTVGGAVNGSQIGFVNTSAKPLKGAQIGYINTVAGSLQGTQIGFINTATGKGHGAQVGFVNTLADSLQGAQVGFVNTATGKADGGQVGFVNATRRLKGTQIGFVNYADTLESGVPLGFLSIVRKGGYQAVEVGVSEMYPINLSLKIGVQKLYSIFSASYYGKLEDDFALGLGLGSIFPLGQTFYFNPELLTQTQFEKESEVMVSLAPQFGLNLIGKLDLVAGPSVVWNYAEVPADLDSPFFSLYEEKLATKHRLYVGLKASLRYTFSKSPLH